MKVDKKLWIKIPIPFSILQKTKGDLPLIYGKGIGSGDFKCPHCNHNLGHLIPQGWDYDNPDETTVFGHYDETHTCEATGKTYTVGFADTAIYDLMKNMMPCDISDEIWKSTRDRYYKNRREKEEAEEAGMSLR